MGENKGLNIDKSVFVAKNAYVAGDVEIGEGGSVWYSATVRGDVASIKVGKRSNVQDGAVIHVEKGFPCIIGDDVTIGHGAIVHGSTVGDRCIIGMGSIILDGAKIGAESIVGAGALVTQGKEFPPRSMILGSPAQVKRTLTDDDVADIMHNAEHYVEMAAQQKTDD